MTFDEARARGNEGLMVQGPESSTRPAGAAMAG